MYAMGVFEPELLPGLSKEEVSGPHLLSELAEQTGGRAFSATDPNDLPSVAARIGIELRNQYVLGLFAEEPEPGWEIPQSRGEGDRTRLHSQSQSSLAAWILRSVPVSSFNDGRRGLPHEEQDCAEQPIREVPAGAV
jgi:hypothetical protein